MPALIAEWRRGIVLFSGRLSVFGTLAQVRGGGFRQGCFTGLQTNNFERTMYLISRHRECLLMNGIFR